MFNERIDTIRHELEWLYTSDGIAFYGLGRLYERYLRLEAELDSLFEQGFYGTEEKRYIIG